MDENFFDLLSGSVEYQEQWEAWKRLCEEHNADGAKVLSLLTRAYQSAKIRGTE